MRKRPDLKFHGFTPFSCWFSLIRMNLKTAIRRDCSGQRTGQALNQIGVYGLREDTLVASWKPLPISIHILHPIEKEGVSPLAEKFRVIANIKRESESNTLNRVDCHVFIGRGSISRVWELNLDITDGKSIRLQGFHLGNDAGILLRSAQLVCRSGYRNGCQSRAVCNMRNRQRPLVLNDKKCSERGFRVERNTRCNCNFRTI